jgi:hypothetical protein
MKSWIGMDPITLVGSVAFVSIRGYRRVKHTAFFGRRMLSTQFESGSVNQVDFCAKAYKVFVRELFRSRYIPAFYFLNPPAPQLPQASIQEA